MQFLTVLKLPAIDLGREVCGQIVRTCVEIVHEVTSALIVTELKLYFFFLVVL
jgi:hypothetical protein